MTKPGLQANYLYMSNGDTDLYGRYWGRGQIRKYFEQFTQFEGKSVLDFGCGEANFVSFEPHGNYTGMDIDLGVINKNKFRLPQYKFEHYDGYNHMYNPHGQERVPTIKNHYDVCVAFSVFTHFTFEETRDIIDVLKKQCDQVLLTYYSNRFRPAYDAICTWKNLESNMWEDIESHDVFYIKTDKWLWSFYDDDWLAARFNAKWHDTKFPTNSIRGLQRCLVI